MDALTSPTTTFLPTTTATLLPTIHKPTALRTTPHLSPYPNLSTSLHKPPPTTTTPLRPSPPRLLSPSTRASTGYAAALLDVALKSNTAPAVVEDARKIVLGRAAEAGGLCEGLVRMLVRKGKAGLVGEVMAEVGKLWDEVCGTKVVVVRAEERMLEEELVGIARKVRRMSGAMNVRIKHIVGPAFAT